MKKTLLITIDFPPSTGGVANYLANFCNNLEENKIVVLADEHEADKHWDNQQKYKVIRNNLYCRAFWPRWLKSLFIAKKIIRQEKIEQILISHVLPFGYVALLLNLPYFVILHGFDLLAAQSTPWKKYWLKKIIRKAKGIIVNSEFTKNEVIKLNDVQNKITVVYPCPNIKPEINETEKQIIKRGFDLEHKKILLSVGRLVLRKGFDMVIKSLPEVLKKIPNLIYLIVGSGQDKDRLESLAEKLNVRGNMILVENVSDANLTAYYDLANVFIMPSRQINRSDVEGFGIVYLEANLFAKPVIAGQGGGAAEAVINGQTGILVDPENEQEISAAILKLFSDPQLANKLGVQGKDRVLNDFQWAKQVGKLNGKL